MGIAPVAHVGNHKSDLLTILDLLELPDLVYHSMSSFMYIPVVPEFFQPAIHYFTRTVNSFICGLVGYDHTLHIDLSYLPMLSRNDVGGTSSKNLLHWIQNVRTGGFN